jgi:hypothetical protein
MLSALFAPPGSGLADPPAGGGQSRFEQALANIASLERPDQDGLATIWDGNKYVQCRRMPDKPLHCEAAGALMQPSLAHTLIPDRVARLAALGWSLDPSFSNYAPIAADPGQ